MQVKFILSEPIINPRPKEGTITGGEDCNQIDEAMELLIATGSSNIAEIVAILVDTAMCINDCDS
jgi:hypothetical protein